jgi:hypothetical protein
MILDYNLKDIEVVEEDNRKYLGEVIYNYFDKQYGNKIFPLFSKYEHEKIWRAFLETEKEGSKDITHFLNNLHK